MPPIEERVPAISMREVDAALAQLEFQSAQWYRARFGEACRLCAESARIRQFLVTSLNYMNALRATGGDISAPMVLVSATMLQIGYLLGRHRAEAEILEGWMRL